MARTTLVLSGSVEKEQAPEIVMDIHYMFDIIESNDLSAEADITNNYVENNSAVQDHMVLKPLEYTLRGFVAEKVFQRRQEITDRISDSLSKIQPIAALAPALSSYAQAVINASSFIEASVNRYVKSLRNIKNMFSKDKTETKSKQEQIAQSLILLQRDRILVDLKTPFGSFKNFLIKSVKISQADTTSQSELTVTVQEYRSVATETTKVDTEKYAGRVASQKAITEDLGKAKGKEDLTSTLYRNTYGALQ